MKKFLVLLLMAYGVAGTAQDTLPGSSQAMLPQWRDALAEQSRWINRLALEPSAYLRQHADNPIDWHPWTESSLADAKSRNRLIFVSVGYASCHWCHVMERTTFSDESVAEVLNETFLSIKVDREQQPDIDAWLSLIAQSLQGEGGWPVTVVLLPDLRPVFAAHYLDREQSLTVLSRLAESWRVEPDLLKRQAEMMTAALPRVEMGTETSVTNRSVSDFISIAVERLLSRMDDDHGGFGTAEKFPDETELQFLLDQYKRAPGEPLGIALHGLLDAFMSGGLSDPVFGGVFRYTTNREMTRPHFEKMLYNQALSARLFAEAGHWLKEPRYRRFAESVLAFTQATLALPDGRFASAVDAEHKGREGGYYLWPESMGQELPAKVKAVAQDQDLFFIGYTGQQAWREGLRQSRSERPRVTGNPITEWNALLLRAFLALDRKEDATALATALWREAWSEEGLERMPGQPAYAADYASMSHGFWQLYAVTLDPRWLNRARALDEQLLKRFYRDGTLLQNQLGTVQLPVSPDDSEAPSPLGSVLTTLSFHGDEPHYQEVRNRLLQQALARLDSEPERAASLWSALAPTPASWAVFGGGHGALHLVQTHGSGAWTVGVRLEPPWHVNANVVPDDYLIPTTLVSRYGDITVDYPGTSMLDADFFEEPIPVFGGQFSLELTGLPTEHPPILELQIQACSDRVCLLPEHLELTAFPRDADPATVP